MFGLMSWEARSLLKECKAAFDAAAHADQEDRADRLVDLLILWRQGADGLKAAEVAKVRDRVTEYMYHVSEDVAGLEPVLLS